MPFEKPSDPSSEQPNEISDSLLEEILKNVAEISETDPDPEAVWQRLAAMSPERLTGVIEQLDEMDKADFTTQKRLAFMNLRQKVNQLIEHNKTAR